MNPPGPLGESIARLPDNVRAEVARRQATTKITGEKLAELIGISYATFKRRMRRPVEFTVGDVANMAIALDVPVARLLDFNGERYR